MPQRGVVLPPVSMFQNLPSVAVAGSCVAYDRRPNFYLVYFLVPTSATTAEFWRLDVLSGALDRLAAPTLAANAVTGISAMCYDESLGRVWLFNSQSTTAAGYEWASWQFYDIATNTWTARNVLSLALAAAWGTDAALVHTDSRISIGTPMGGQPADDHIYLCGNGAVPLYRFSIVGNTWTALAGGGGARGGLPGAGSNLIWNEWNNDVLTSWRGGGSALVDVYTISTDTWAAGVTPNPGLVCAAGFESASLHSHGSTSLLASGGVLYAYDHVTSRIQTLARIYGLDGVAHLGNGLFYYSLGAFSHLYVGLRLHSSNQIQRIGLDI